MNREIFFETEYADDTLCAADSLLRLVSTERDVGKRVDVFICENSELTRSAAVRLIESGEVLLEGASGKLSKNYKLREGDVITVSIPAPEPSDAAPENIPIDVVYEDADIIVVIRLREWWCIPHPEIRTARSSTLCFIIARDSFRVSEESSDPESCTELTRTRADFSS